MSSLNIVELIERSPITRLRKDYENKLLTKIKNTFTDTQQQLFVSSFYAYLNYNSETDFVIDFDNVWKWIGFSTKANAKKTLEKHFTIDIDFKVDCVVIQLDENSSTIKDKKGGRPNETILLSVLTFKKFCMKANTKKADESKGLRPYHPYFNNYFYNKNEAQTSLNIQILT